MKNAREITIKLSLVTGCETVDQEQYEDDDGKHGDIHEEHLSIESVSLEIHNLNGLIEDGIEEKVALSIPENQFIKNRSQ